jgi:hypothetical protein
MILLIVSIFVFIVLAALGLLVIRRKNVDIIAMGALSRKRESYDGLRHVFFCFADHFEPFWSGADEATAMRRVDEWRKRYEGLFDEIRDKGGNTPRHSFFYPAEEYHPDCLDMLAELRAKRLGDVEIHLHHDRDTSSGFREKIVAFRDVLYNRHGLLRRNAASGLIEYGFIHGNWALDDSGSHGRFCGVKDEITILKETGCYSDFTYPTQPPAINRIYYASDDPFRSKSHHKGVDACFGREPSGDLLLITGPLAVNWRKRRRGIFPAIENGDITDMNPPTRDRVDLWMKTGIAVRGWPRWVFVKVHTHGAQERNAGFLLANRIKEFHRYMLSRYNDGSRYLLHYVTAWEMYNCIKVLERRDQEWINRIEDFDYPS